MAERQRRVAAGEPLPFTLNEAIRIGEDIYRRHFPNDRQRTMELAEAYGGALYDAVWVAVT